MAGHQETRAEEKFRLGLKSMSWSRKGALERACIDHFVSVTPEMLADHPPSVAAWAIAREYVVAMNAGTLPAAERRLAGLTIREAAEGYLQFRRANR